MRILCCDPNGGAFHHITKAWGRAFSHLGHQFQKWDGRKQSWLKFRPQLYLGCSGHRQPIPQDLRKRFGTKVGIHVNPYGKEKLDRVHGNDINEPQAAVNWTVSVKPDFAFGYGLQKDEKRFWTFYREKHGIPWYGVPTAGDMLHYYPESKDDLKCDVGFVGGRWPYKAHNIDKYLVPILKKFNYKCFGWGGWDGVAKSTVLPDNTNVDRQIFSSAKVCPSVCEPHTTIYGIDWPERIFKIPLCGGFTISDKVINFNDYVPSDVFPMAENPSEFMNLCNHYVKNDEERNELANKQRRYMVDNHTYFDRVKTFMLASGFKNEADEVDGKKEELFKSQAPS